MSGILSCSPCSILDSKMDGKNISIGFFVSSFVIVIPLSTNGSLEVERPKDLSLWSCISPVLFPFEICDTYNSSARPIDQFFYEDKCRIHKGKCATTQPQSQ
ncbi:hypothetical protein SLE2022_401130 [Rubroshorea leprosula]